MGIKVAATNVAILGSVSKLVSLLSAVGVGEVGTGGRSVTPLLISGSGASGGDVLCSISLPSGGVGLSELGCGVKAISGWTVGSVLCGMEEVLLSVVCVGIPLVVVGVVGFKVLFLKEEILPGAGGDAVLRALTRDVGIFPPGGGGAGGREEPGWVGLDFFPEIGTGAVLTEGLGLGVVVVLRESKTLDFGVEVLLFDGGCGGFSFSLGDL